MKKRRFINYIFLRSYCSGILRDAIKFLWYLLVYIFFYLFFNVTLSVRYYTRTLISREIIIFKLRRNIFKSIDYVF